MWDYDSLNAKAKKFIRRGLSNEDPDHEDVPFWCFLGLELLLRATLAKVHPALLADPQDGGGDSVFYSLGINTGNVQPKSIPTHTVVKRCGKICADLTSTYEKKIMVWVNYRNEDLHTGSLVWSTVNRDDWYPDFCKVVSILLGQNDEERANFFGSELANEVDITIQSLDADKRSEARAEVKKAKEKFDSLNSSERSRRLGEAESKRISLMRSWTDNEAICPACNAEAFIRGELSRSSDPIHEDGELLQRNIYVPVMMKCCCCDLELNGHDLLYALNLGAHYTKTHYLDPVDYYDIPRPEDLWEPDYGND